MHYDSKKFIITNIYLQHTNRLEGAHFLSLAFFNSLNKQTNVFKNKSVYLHTSNILKLRQKRFCGIQI